MVPIEVIIDRAELKGIHHVDEFIKSKLRAAGVPVSGFFSVDEKVPNGQLTKYTLTDKLIKFVWSK